MLNTNDINNLKIFLARVTLKAEEAETFIDLIKKLNEMEAELAQPKEKESKK